MNAPSTSGPQPAAIPNKLDMNTLMSRAKELGEQAGKGSDVQIKFLLSACEGGYHGAVDLTKGKNGNAEIDDAVLLSEAYYKARSGSTMFDAKADNQQKLISTVRTSIKLGQWPKGGQGEPLATVHKLINMFQQARKDPIQRKGLQDAANAFLSYARAQLKADTLIDDDEGLKQFLRKPSREKATAEERVEAVRNALQNLIKGKDGVQDASAEVRAAAQSLTDRLVKIAKGKGKSLPGGAP